MEAAVKEVFENKCSLQSSADNYGVTKSALLQSIAE
jgi:hypothetical protein